jgi:hypothetical protein
MINPIFTIRMTNLLQRTGYDRRLLLNNHINREALIEIEHSTMYTEICYTTGTPLKIFPHHNGWRLSCMMTVPYYTIPEKKYKPLYT